MLANVAPDGQDIALTLLEDVAYTFSVGDFGFRDTNDAVPNPFLAVKLTSRPALGVVTNGGYPVSAGQFITVADVVAGKLRFQPAGNDFGTNYTSFAVQVQDDGGTVNGGIDLDPTPSVITINLLPVNDPPGGKDAYAAFYVTPYALRVADFGFSDLADAPPNSLLAVKIAATPNSGTLTNGGVTVVAGQFISAADIAAGRLQYVQAPDVFGVGLMGTFAFQLQDDGGTANDGTDLDPTPRTFKLEKDIPCGCPVNHSYTMLTMLEDSAYPFKVDDFVSVSNAPNLQYVQILTLPYSGTLTNNFNPVFPGTAIAPADINAEKLIFWPPPNANGNAAAFFSYRGVYNQGPSDFSRTISLNILPVNDQPQGSDKAIPLLEDNNYTFQTADFGFSDIFEYQGFSQFLGVKIGSLPERGALWNSGLAIPAGQVVAASDIAAGKLVYSPVPNAVGASAASFKFQVKDDGGTANGGVDLDLSANTITFNVTGVNDAPVGTDRLLPTLENVPYSLNVAAFGFADPFDSPSNNFLGVIIFTLPQNGSLTNGNVPVVPGQLVTLTDIAAGHLRYTRPPNGSGAAVASFQFFVKDNGGTAAGGLDVALLPNTITLNLFGCPNGVPSSSRDRTIHTLEDRNYTFSYIDFSLSDPFDLPDSVEYLKIISTPSVGSLQSNGLVVVPGQIVAVSDIAAGRLRFLPTHHANGSHYTIFAFQVVSDDQVVNPCADNGMGTIAINLTSVNDPPSGTDGAVMTLEDTAYTFPETDFALQDTSDQPPNTLQSVKITTLPAKGALTVEGQSVAIGQFIAIADIQASKLKFTSAANANGSGYASFTFQVKDDGGTAHGGVDLDPTPNTITFDVTPVNDRPIAVSNTIIILEDSAYTFASPDFGFNDYADVPPNNFAAVKVTTLPTQGMLLLTGNAVVAGQFVAVADLGMLTFQPAANGNGLAYIKFTFQVQDDGGDANGGRPLDDFARTMTVAVTPVNDVPSFSKGTNLSVTDRAGTQTLAGWAELLPAGPIDEATQQLRFEVEASNPALFAVQPGVDAAGKLTFTPRENAFGSAEISVVLVDGGGTANGGVDRSAVQTFTIDVALHHPLHNRVQATDVTGDGDTFAEDALNVINYINARGSGPVDTNLFQGNRALAASVPAKVFYYDVTDDDYISADDVVAIINYINARRGIETEAPTATFEIVDKLHAQDETLLLLLAADVATQSRRHK